MTALKNELIGRWSLLSYIEVPVGGGDSCFPLGKSPKGNLLFSPDGYMSLQITASDPVNYNMEDRLKASEMEAVNRFYSYIAFSGVYTVDNMISSVVYHIDTSLYPKWEGTKQIRKVDFEGDVLYQKSIEPILSGGQMVHAYMTWKRSDKDQVVDEEHDEQLSIFK